MEGKNEKALAGESDQARRFFGHTTGYFCTTAGLTQTHFHGVWDRNKESHYNNQDWVMPNNQIRHTTQNFPIQTQFDIVRSLTRSTPMGEKDYWDPYDGFSDAKREAFKDLVHSNTITFTLEIPYLTKQVRLKGRPFLHNVQIGLKMNKLTGELYDTAEWSTHHGLNIKILYTFKTEYEVKQIVGQDNLEQVLSCCIPYEQINTMLQENGHRVILMKEKDIPETLTPKNAPAIVMVNSGEHKYDFIIKTENGEVSRISGAVAKVEHDSFSPFWPLFKRHYVDVKGEASLAWGDPILKGLTKSGHVFDRNTNNKSFTFNLHY